MNDEEEDELSESAERVLELMERLADEFGVETDITVEEDRDTISGEFEGDDLGRLIGHHGQTIDAIQHLAYRIAFHGIDQRKSVTVDAAGYRERRAVSLRASGDQAADAAVRDGRPVSLEPMSANERKVVHEHLKTRRDVETYTEGQEPSRRLVVAPVV